MRVALLMGKPVIATNYSGSIDLFTQVLPPQWNFTLIPYVLTPVRVSSHFPQGLAEDWHVVSLQFLK